MTNPDFNQNYFELFHLPVQFGVDAAVLGEQYRQLQREMHPDRYANAPAQQQRIAVQYSSLINEAYATLSKPLSRALYLLELAGMNREQIAAEPVDGGFLIEQMELREKLESLHDLVDPDTVIDHLLKEIGGDIRTHQVEFSERYAAGELDAAASACVKMQYLEKLLQEAEEKESELMDKD
jgi:molecular chaperone HscB